MPEGIDLRLEQLARRRAQMLAVLPSTEGVVQTLRDVVDHGLPGYQEPPEEPFTIPPDVSAEFRERLLAWEERHQDRARLWAEDRFRLGFALGSGLSADLLVDLP